MGGVGLLRCFTPLIDPERGVEAAVAFVAGDSVLVDATVVAAGRAVSIFGEVDFVNDRAAVWAAAVCNGTDGVDMMMSMTVVVTVAVVAAMDAAVGIAPVTLAGVGVAFVAVGVDLSFIEYVAAVLIVIEYASAIASELTCATDVAHVSVRFPVPVSPVDFDIGALVEDVAELHAVVDIEDGVECAVVLFLGIGSLLSVPFLVTGLQPAALSDGNRKNCAYLYEWKRRMTFVDVLDM